MDLNKFEEFKKKIERSLNQMEAKISFLHDGVKGLKESHKEFQGEMTDFMSFMAEGRIK
ncbi:MAG: hypothetical protein AAGC64_13045 [Bacteroidota bacterium]